MTLGLIPHKGPLADKSDITHLLSGSSFDDLDPLTTGLVLALLDFVFCTNLFLFNGTAPVAFFLAFCPSSSFESLKIEEKKSTGWLE